MYAYKLVACILLLYGLFLLFYPLYYKKTGALITGKVVGNERRYMRRGRRGRTRVLVWYPVVEFEYMGEMYQMLSVNYRNSETFVGTEEKFYYKAGGKKVYLDDPNRNLLLGLLYTFGGASIIFTDWFRMLFFHWA